MKKVILLALLATAWAAWAQEQKKEPAMAQEAATPAVEAAAKPAADDAKCATAQAGKPAAAKRSRRQQDARHCLQKGSNTEIIKCAEAYL